MEACKNTLRAVAASIGLYLSAGALGGNVGSMHTSTRAIAVVTGSRAEFGLLAPVMRAIAAHDALRLQTIVTGTHLTTDSRRDITEAGFAIDAAAPMQQAGHTGRAADAAALGRGVEHIGEALARLQPAVALVLGDRIEALAGAAAASVSGVVVAHIHGGDRAEGVADEAMRHAITKLAHLHFPATAQSRRRIIRMGEARERVHRVGSPAIDGLKQIEPASDAASVAPGLDQSPEVIVLQHPIGAAPEQERHWMAGTLAATAGRSRLVLMPNHDAGREGVARAIDEAGIEPIAHLPRGRFLAVLKAARLLVGNSSAGLIEAAALKRAAINIGPRQNGREKPAHVIDCNYGETPVTDALHRAEQLDLRRLRHPYGRGDAGRCIAEHLAAIDLNDLPRRKRNVY